MGNGISGLCQENIGCKVPPPLLKQTTLMCSDLFHQHHVALHRNAKCEVCIESVNGAPYLKNFSVKNFFRWTTSSVYHFRGKKFFGQVCCNCFPGTLSHFFMPNFLTHKKDWGPTKIFRGPPAPRGYLPPPLCGPDNTAHCHWSFSTDSMDNGFSLNYPGPTGYNAINFILKTLSQKLEILIFSVNSDRPVCWPAFQTFHIWSNGVADSVAELQRFRDICFSWVQMFN